MHWILVILRVLLWIIWALMVLANIPIVRVLQDGNKLPNENRISVHVTTAIIDRGPKEGFEEVPVIFLKIEEYIEGMPPVNESPPMRARDSFSINSVVYTVLSIDIKNKTVIVTTNKATIAIHLLRRLQRNLKPLFHTLFTFKLHNSPYYDCNKL